MAIRETLLLDLAEAQRQVDALEAQLDSLFAPITIPVQIEADQAIAELRRQLAQADAQTVDVDVDVEGVNEAATEFGRLENEVEDTETDLRRLERTAENSSDAVLRVGTTGASAFTNLRGSILGVVAGLGAIQAARGLISFFGDSIDAASDFEESLSKTGVVFGDFAGSIEEFATNAPADLGLSTAAALEATSTFGNLFVALGLTQQAAADLSPDIIQLAADLASFNNIEVADAVEKLRAGLVGEAEPLRTLGVNINEAATQAKALELGLVGANGQLSEAAKVQARYALILEQTATAQGDFARTADGLANTQRTVAAEFENARQEIGQALVPAYEAILDILPGLIEGLEQLEPAFRAVGEGIGSAAEGAGGFVEDLGRVAAAAPGVGSALADIVGSGVNFTQALGSIFSGDIDRAIDEVGESIEGVGSAIDTINFNQIQDSLVQDLQSGVEPARALEEALTQLNKQGFDTDQITAYATTLAEVSGADTGNILDIIDNVKAFGRQAGLTEEEVAALVDGLSALFVQPQGDLAAEMADLRNFGGAVQDLTSDTEAEAEALRTLQGAAEDLGVPLSEMLDNVKALPPELEELASKLSPATLEFIAQADAITGFRDELGELPGALQAAGDAMVDEEDNIVADFSTFLDNLADEVSAQRAFQTNLDLLRSFGLDNLATAFEEQGIEAADLLSQAVADPAAALEAERLLDTQYAGVTQSLIDTMKDVIEGDTTVSMALLGLVSQAQTDLDETPLVIPVTLDDEVVIPPNLLEGIDVGTVVIPTTTGPPSGGGGGGTTSGGGGGAEPPPNLVESVSVTQNFFATPTPTTDTARAGQTAAAVISARK